jgi:predicted metalloprotease
VAVSQTPPSPETTGSGAVATPEVTAPPADGAPGTAPDAASPADTVPDATLPPIDGPVLEVTIPFDDVVDVDDNKPPRPYDEFVAVAFTDIERWWGEVYPTIYGSTYQPLEGGIYAGYPERDTAIPGCGSRTTDYADLQLYVAFYCQFGDFMAYDDGNGRDSLLEPLADAYGPAVLGIVLAHEYGHAIQSRIGALDRPLATIVTEQQADCFAGAWTGQAYRGESPLLRLGDSDVRAGLLEVRDPVGTDQFQPGGHGSAFDRVGAFQEGFLDGPGRCAELLDDPLPLMPNQFQGAVDFQRGGNASYDCSDDPRADCRPAPEFLAEDINDFWSTELGPDFAPVTARPITGDFASAACEGRVDLAAEVAVCPVERAVIFDEPAIRELYDEFGDFSLGYFYGIAWAELVQEQLDSSLQGEPRALLDDCLTGAWVRDITPDQFGRTGRSTTSVSASPGDLDEAIRIAILVGDPGADVDVVGSPFEKITSFRTGVLGGLDACLAQLNG